MNALNVFDRGERGAIPRMAVLWQGVRRNRLAWLLIGAWALGMMSLPIVLWLSGDGLLPAAATVTTVLQAAAVVVILAAGWGWRRTLTSVATIAVIGWGIEYIGSTTGLPFGRYAYTARLQPQAGGVPLLIPVAWFMFLPCAWSVARYLAGKRRWLPVMLSVLAFVAWDLFLDPQMVMWDFWRWGNPGGYFGIPWSNYLGWAVAALVMTLIVRPPATVPGLLMVIYGLTWFFEVVGLFFFWDLRGPAVAGGLVMGGFLMAVVLKVRYTAQ